MNCQDCGKKLDVEHFGKVISIVKCSPCNAADIVKRSEIGIDEIVDSVKFNRDIGIRE